MRRARISSRSAGPSFTSRAAQRLHVRDLVRQCDYFAARSRGLPRGIRPCGVRPRARRTAQPACRAARRSRPAGSVDTCSRSAEVQAHVQEGIGLAFLRASSSCSSASSPAPTVRGTRDAARSRPRPGALRGSAGRRSRSACARPPGRRPCRPSRSFGSSTARAALAGGLDERMRRGLARGLHRGSRTGPRRCRPGSRACAPCRRSGHAGSANGAHPSGIRPASRGQGDPRPPARSCRARAPCGWRHGKYVRVHRDERLAEGGIEHHVGGFSADPRQRLERGAIARHFAAVLTRAGCGRARPGFSPSRCTGRSS
jgi:hypothetical protein